MIATMNKFTLLTFASRKNALLREFQRFESVHFKNLVKDDGSELDFMVSDYSGEEISAAESELAKINFAISKIAPHIEKPKGLKGLTAPRPSLSFDEFESFTAGYDYLKAYNTVKENDEMIKACKAEAALQNAEIQSLSVWSTLDVLPGQLDQAKSVRYLIGTVPGEEAFREEFESRIEHCYVEFFGGSKEESAVLAIVLAEDYESAESVAKSLGFSKTVLDSDLLPRVRISMAKSRLDELKKTETKCLAAIIGMSGEFERLKIAADYFTMLLERAKARENFLRLQKGGAEDETDIVLIEGWSPEESVQELKGIVSSVCGDEAYLEVESVPKDSADVPIKLKNNKFAEAFESITEMYNMPKYNEIDPTPLLAPFYALFFGLMVGDAGYGAVLCIATALILKFVPLKKSMRQFMRFFHYLGYATIFAGFLYGSLFGFSFFQVATGADGAKKAILDAQTDIIQLMIFSVALGFVHLIFGLIVKGYMLIRDGKWLDAIFDSLFWIIAVTSMVGLIVGAAGVLSEGLTAVCKWALIGSLTGLLLTQGREYASVAGKFGGGIYGVYGITSYVGDLISYARIAALMLSGAYIAFSFNLIAGLMPAGFARIVFGFIIVVLGALLNMGLAMLGAYVHTCRLQYVEFFGKFYEGGGRPYKPFELKNSHVDIKK